MKNLNREETKTFFASLNNHRQAGFDGENFYHPVKGEMVPKEAVETAVRNEIGKGNVLVNYTDLWFVENAEEFFTWKGVSTHLVNGRHAGLYGFEMITAHGLVRKTELFGMDLSEPPKPKELPAPKIVEKVKVKDEPVAPSNTAMVAPISDEPVKSSIDGLIEAVLSKINPEQLTKVVELFAGLMEPEPASVSATVEKPVSFTDRPQVINLSSDEQELPLVVPVVEEAIEPEPKTVVEKTVQKKPVKKQQKQEKVKVQDEPPTKPKNLDSNRKGWKKSFKDLATA